MTNVSCSLCFLQPKSKLYYGNRHCKYYRYNQDVDPPFEEVAQQASTTTDLEPVLHPDRPTTSAASGNAGKKSIAIKLKTTSFKQKKIIKSKSKSGEKPAPPSSSSSTKVSPSSIATASTISDRVQKSNMSNIEKWSERKQEQKQDIDMSVDAREGDNGSVEKATVPIAKTAKGEPICSLCRRKFPTLEKLRYHERVSKLHEENLAKKKAGEQEKKKKQHQAQESAANLPPRSQPSSQQKTTYVDRARKRRTMHGGDSMTSSASSSVLLRTGLVASSAGTVPPSVLDADSRYVPVVQPQPPQRHDPLGTESLGHKMLAKLGWKGPGATLGRGSVSAGEEADGSDGRLRRQQEHAETHQAMHREWDRIESIAAFRGRGGRRNSKRGRHQHHAGGTGGKGIGS